MRRSSSLHFFLKKMLALGIFLSRLLYVCLTTANNPSKIHQGV